MISILLVALALLGLALGSFGVIRLQRARRQRDEEAKWAVMAGELGGELRIGENGKLTIAGSRDRIEWVLHRAFLIGQTSPAQVSSERHWLLAIAFADPDLAIRVVDRLIAQAKDSPNGVRGTELPELLNALAQPNEAAIVRGLFSNAGWPVDNED